MFYNEDHKKHIKIGPLKILSDEYLGINIAEEIKKPLLNIVADNNMTYVVCQRTVTMVQVFNEWLKTDIFKTMGKFPLQY